jgi:hypothetical protein
MTLRTTIQTYCGYQSNANVTTSKAISEATGQQTPTALRTTIQTYVGYLFNANETTF